MRIKTVTQIFSQHEDLARPATHVHLEHRARAERAKAMGDFLATIRKRLSGARNARLLPMG